jgi:hypothetical protein
VTPRIEEINAEIDAIKQAASDVGRELSASEREHLTELIIERAALYRDIKQEREAGTRALIHDMGREFRQGHAKQQMLQGAVVLLIALGATVISQTSAASTGRVGFLFWSGLFFGGARFIQGYRRYRSERPRPRKATPAPTTTPVAAPPGRLSRLTTGRRGYAVLAGFFGLAITVQLALPDWVLHPTDENGIPREGIRVLPLWGSSFDRADAWYEDGLAIDPGDDRIFLSVDSSYWDDPEHEDDYVGRVWWRHTFRRLRDLSVRVEVRSLASAPEDAGCLVARTAVLPWDDETGYWLCIDGYGVYGHGDESGLEYFARYDDPARAEMLRPVEEWNTLKIIARDETLWLFANGHHIGTVEDVARKGRVGVLVEAYGPDGAQFEFRDLKVYKLGWLF